MTSTEVSASLLQLHAEYVEKLNAAWDEGRADLAWELVDSYTDEALLLITSEDPMAAHPSRQAPDR